jgi:hypothetical protein
MRVLGISGSLRRDSHNTFRGENRQLGSVALRRSRRGDQFARVPSKSIVVYVPSQNGLFDECPHRHIDIGSGCSNAGFVPIDLGGLVAGGVMQQLGGPVAGVNLIRL